MALQWCYAVLVAQIYLGKSIINLKPLWQVSGAGNIGQEEEQIIEQPKLGMFGYEN